MLLLYQMLMVSFFSSLFCSAGLDSKGEATIKIPITSNTPHKLYVTVVSSGSFDAGNKG